MRKGESTRICGDHTSGVLHRLLGTMGVNSLISTYTTLQGSLTRVHWSLTDPLIEFEKYLTT